MLIMVAGGTLVGGTYVFAKIPAPEALPAGQSTRVYYADGKTEMARIGKENRTIVALDKIPKHMQHAVIAAEDRTFYENDGVDVAGIVRAAWNNVSGGDQQGASTITQQYARKIAELTEDSYKRKAEEAAIAMKLTDKYTKDQILGFYLNTVYFGRGAYGVEAAAQAYFKKPTAMDLTVEESIMLAGFIKNPDSGSGSSAFDPNVNPDAAKARFEGNRDALVLIQPKLAKYGGGTYQVNNQMQMPMPPKYDPKSRDFQAQFGLDQPTGLVVHNVMDELSKLKETDRNVGEVPDLKTAGLKVITTIDLAAQGAAQTYADVKGEKSPLKGVKDNITAALVAVEPYTGRVVAYYGGPNGAGTDYAGSWEDPILGDGKRTTGGYHPPASSFKVYTLAAALAQGISVKSYWNGKERSFPGLPLGSPNAIRNANPEGACANSAGCTLADMTAQSLNVPFFALTMEHLDNKAASVLETARAAGIRTMRADDGEIIDLNAHKSTELANTGKNTTSRFNYQIGFGQYGVTVVDHANGLATLAAGGQAAKVHFIAEIYQGDNKIFTESKKLTPMPGYTAGNAADEAAVLQKVSAKYGWVPKGTQVAAKTGTWENYNSRGENAHSWTVGYTAPNKSKGYNGIAVAVWVGNKGDELPIKTPGGAKMGGSNGAGEIFKAFVKKAVEGKSVGKFPEPKFLGDETAGDGKSADPSSGQSQPGQGNPGPGGTNRGPGGNNSTGPGNGGGGGNRDGRD